MSPSFAPPAAGLLTQTVLTLNASGEASTSFTVPMGPGNNFRVASLLDTPGAAAHLDKLQVTNLVADYYVTPDQEQVEGFVGALSPMLTVWRKLHLEFDSMTAPPSSGPEANYVSGTISAVRLNFPAPGRSQVAVVYTGTEEGPRLFERGKLEVPGIGTFAVTNSWTLAYVNGRAGTTVEIPGAPAGLLANQAVKLYDDDDQYLANDPLYPSNLGLQSPPLPALGQAAPFVQAAQPKFAAAYITLVDANAKGWNTQPTINFKRYIAPYLTTGTILDNGNLQLKGTDRSDFWAFSVVFAYQPSTVFGLFGIGPVVEVAFYDDGDSDREVPLTGATRKNPATGTPEAYSVVFLEAIRDYEFGRRAASDPLPEDFVHPIRAAERRKQYIERIFVVTAHEIGHSPGQTSESSDHNELDIMEKGGPQFFSKSIFSPRTISRFRRATSWTR